MNFIPNCSAAGGDWLVRLVRCFCAAATLLITSAFAVTGAPISVPPLSLQPATNSSVRHEVRHAIDKGLAWLEQNQNTNGFWSTPDHPAMTALVLDAFQLRPDRDPKSEPVPVQKGYDYLMSCVQSDGGIYRKEMQSYNTSVALMAILLRERPENQPVITKARKFLIGLQVESGDPADPFNGGIGYGATDKRPDLSNTVLAMEALYCSKRPWDEKSPAEPDLNWKAAIHFVQSCQNLPSYNSEKWASDDPQNKGGFVYAPGQSMAGETNLPSGRVALRSYGSMGYAGLLSYIYADLKPDDPRVTAVKEWLRTNYTVEENPVMGLQGVYYYYFVMSKALTLCDLGTLDTKDGKTVNWREQLALKLINLQQADGSWTNSNGRWWEKDPALDSAFSLIALDMIYNKL
jgi:squalene-hopene/tetraprenyl-beta-curcumene cyclase